MTVKLSGAILGLLALLGAASPAAADSIETRKHLVYGEAFGKLGLYSLGYEYALSEWLSVGAAGSATVASSRTILATSVYLGAGGELSGPHRWFVQVGPELVRESEPAVPGFDGLTSLGIGGQITAGYELRKSRWLLRGHAVMTAGKGGVAPWAGFSFGVRL